ncbi:MAG: T9SS type A sorting domain-containing protein, partial [Cyanobacteria bacterium P01_D01_bin.56]
FGAVIISTNDGGNTWTEMTADQNEPFRAIDFSPTRGFITTQNGDIMVLELTTSTSSAIEELFANVSLYPNPTQDRLYITGLDRSISIFGWRITHFNGQTIRTSESEIWPSAPIDLSRIPPGTYIFSLETSKGWTNKLFVKQ